MSINEFKSTDLRYDLELNWDEEENVRKDPQASAERSVYARSQTNQALFEEAQLEFERNHFPEAQQALESLLGSDPNDFESWTQLGTVQFRVGKRLPALKSYQRALSLNPDFVPALFNLGKLEMLNQVYDRVIELLGRVVLFDPGRAEAYYFLGEAHLQIKQGSKAVEFFHKALELEYRQFLAKRPESPQRAALERYIAAQRKP